MRFLPVYDIFSCIGNFFQLQEICDRSDNMTIPLVNKFPLGTRSFLQQEFSFCDKNCLHMMENIWQWPYFCVTKLLFFLQEQCYFTEIYFHGNSWQTRVNFCKNLVEAWLSGPPWISQPDPDSITILKGKMPKNGVFVPFFPRNFW